MSEFENKSIIVTGAGSGIGRATALRFASKGGLLQFTRAIAVEYAHLGIRANCVCPGAIKTNLGEHTKEDSPSWTTKPTMDARKYKFDVPIQRYANPEEVANLITFAASDEASFVSGSAIMVDGGLTAV